MTNTHQFDDRPTISDEVVPERVRRHFEHVADRVERRMLGNTRRRKGYDVGEAKPAWDATRDRGRFLSQLWKIAPEYPHAVDAADAFEAAVAAANGNAARFRHELQREFDLRGLP
jgi:hypothetical protein